MVDEKLSNQELFWSHTALIEPGLALTLTVDLLDCGYQVDLFYGPLIESFDPRNGLYYGERLLASKVILRDGFCELGSPTPTATTTPSATPTPSIAPTSPPT